MGVFTRFKDIVGANINAMLDKAEDPEKMIRLMTREMEDTLVEMKSACAATLAEKAKTERERKDLSERVARWDERARLAVEKKRDELAKEALIEKKSAVNQLALIDKDLAHMDKLVEESRANILQLEEKLETVKQKHRVLVQRAVHAKETRRSRESIRSASGSDAAMRFDELERRIEQMEAEAEMAGVAPDNDLEREFSHLEAGADIEKELADLKQNVKAQKSEKNA